MKVKHLLTLTIALIWLMLMSFTVFEVKIGKTSCYEEGFSVIPVGSNFLVSGNQNCSGAPNDWNSYFIMLNSQGDTLWSKTGIHVNGFAKMLTDGNIIFSGGNKASLTYDTIMISKADTEGNLLWSKSFFFGVCKNTVTDLYPVADGFLVSGFFSVNSCINPSYDAFLMKLDTEGNTLWTKTFTGNYDEQFHAVRPTPDGKIAVAGWTNSSSAFRTADYLLALYDNSGSLIDYNIYGDDLHNYGYGLEVLPDGSMILIGYSDKMDVIKTDKDLRPIWTKSFGASCGTSYFKVKLSSDNTVILTATEPGNNGCVSSVYKMKFDGEVMWKKTFQAIVRDFNETDKGRYIITGFADYKSNVFVALFDSARNYQRPILEMGMLDIDTEAYLQEHGIATSVNEALMEQKSPKVKVYPNPSDRFVHIEFHNPASVNYRLEIFDISGSIVYINPMIPDNKVLVERGSLSSGVYTYKLSGAGNIHCGKVMFN